MQMQMFNLEAPKKPANLSINSDLLRIAREERINLSQTLENALAESIRVKKRREWFEKSREAVEEYNKFVEKHGCFGDAVRCF